MADPAVAVLRFLRGWFRGRSLHGEWGRPGADGRPTLPDLPRVRTERAVIGDAAGQARITGRWYLPATVKRPLPGWLILHGVAVQGTDHPALARLAAALASAGTVVLLPEIPAWSQLKLDPLPARPIVAQSLKVLCADPRVLSGGAMLAGVSFGCPQVLSMGAEFAETRRIRGILGFGGYSDLQAVIRFGLTGEYEWQGRMRHMRPDPYGRWVAGANYLHRIPGYEGAEEASLALHELAVHAARCGVVAWDPVYDALKKELAEPLAPPNRALFRLFAPPSDRDPDPGRVGEMASLIVEAAREAHPLLELPDSLTAAALPPVHLIHGRGDPLIPYTETLALERKLRGPSSAGSAAAGGHAGPAGARRRGPARMFGTGRRNQVGREPSDQRRTAPGGGEVTATVTSFFAHARDSDRIASKPAEAARTFGTLRSIMALQKRPLPPALRTRPHGAN